MNNFWSLKVFFIFYKPGFGSDSNNLMDLSTRPRFKFGFLIKLNSNEKKKNT